jgi:hypothetical protein
MGGRLLAKQWESVREIVGMASHGYAQIGWSHGLFACSLHSAFYYQYYCRQVLAISSPIISMSKQISKTKLQL